VAGPGSIGQRAGLSDPGQGSDQDGGGGQGDHDGSLQPWAAEDEKAEADVGCQADDDPELGFHSVIAVILARSERRWVGAAWTARYDRITPVELRLDDPVG
jgi:hypothetical protein